MIRSYSVSRSARTSSRAWRAGSFVLSALFTFTGAGEAQEREEEQRADSAQAVQTVTVQAKRAPLVVGGTSALVTSIDSLELPAAPQSVFENTSPCDDTGIFSALNNAGR